VALVGLGCRANQADLEALAGRLAPRFDLGSDGSPAEFVVVNTCAVTVDAAATARRAIRRAAREHPGAAIVATGCCAEAAPETLRGLPGVAAVAGASARNGVAALLEALRDGADPEAALARGVAAASAEPWAPPAVERRGHARPLLKVQDGCDARCAYCVVPRARGASRSMPFDAAVAALCALGSRHAEVVLTGVHLGAYGRDLRPARSLAGLVLEAVARGLRARVRLSSVEPLEFPRELLRASGRRPAVCEHFHLPLQSGSDRVLAAMRRPYRAAAYQAVVEEVAARVPGACLGADVMTGFPGETEADHRATVALVEALPLAYLHVFPFSPRPGTDAASRPDPVTGEVARARARELLAISEQRWGAYLAAQAGEEAEVVVERIADGVAGGTAGRYVPVRWPAAGERRGDLVRVRIVGRDGDGCAAVRADTPT
jgi:threonylcarbamoyladenosine tRNA methylthiotransferase MtaB